MRRFSILEMMGGVGLFAIGLTALRNANEFWQSIVVTLTAAALGVALLGAWQLRGPEGAWWSGFAAFGFGYLILTLGPWFDTHVGPITATSYLLESVRDSAGSGSWAYDRELGELESRQKSLTDWLAARRSSTGGSDDPTMAGAVTELQALATRVANVRSAEPAGPKRVRALLPGVMSGAEFTQIGHCLFALVAASIGATVSRRMWSRRQARASPDSNADAGPT